MFGNITGHANNRSFARLGGLVDDSLLSQIEWVAQEYSKEPKIYYEARKFSKVKHINENGYSINGDAIVAVIKYGRIATIMLAKSWRTDYFSDGIYIS